MLKYLIPKKSNILTIIQGSSNICIHISFIQETLRETALDAVYIFKEQMLQYIISKNKY